MVSDEENGETEQPGPFRYVHWALAAIAIHTVLVLATPPNPIRSAFAIAALLGTGYCALSLVLGRSVPLTLLEMLAFVVGFSIIAISAAALLVSSLGIPFDVLIIDSVGLPVAVIASMQAPWHRPSRRDVSAFLSGLINLRDYTRFERAVTMSLLAAVLVVTVVVIAALYATTYPDVLSPALAITGPDGTPDTLPTAFIVDEPKEIVISALGGSIAENVTLVIQLVPTNATGNGTFHPILWDALIQLDPYGEARKDVALEARGTWSEVVAISVTTPGTFWLRFKMAEASAAPAASNQLAISVSP